MRNLTLIICLFFSFTTYAQLKNIRTEWQYEQLSKALTQSADSTDFFILIESLPTLGPQHSLAVDVLWDSSVHNPSPEVQKRVVDVATTLLNRKLALKDRLRLFELLIRLGKDESHLFKTKRLILWQLGQPRLSKETVSTLLAAKDFWQQQLGDDFFNTTVSKNKAAQRNFDLLNRSFQPMSRNQMRDLFFYQPDLENFAGGHYFNTATIFLLCRKNRDFPCRYIVKNKFGEFMKNQDGSLWTQPALAQSKYSLPYHQRNGYTPSGVYTMDSVMPYANKQKVFGKFRRIILNFIPESQGEELLKLLLPGSSHKKSWWRESIVARDVGRNLLRIHGTGLVNTDPHSTHYPHIMTSGCVSQIEGEYKSIEFKDQQNLLDQLMISLGLDVLYVNEPDIKGLLYLIEVDNQQRAVEENDIELLLTQKN